jgi:hypothetical protein
MKSVVFTFGRMNPPTTGHQLLVNKLAAFARANKSAPRVYLSHSVGKKDPLPYDKKLAFARAAFGPMVRKSNSKNIIQILKDLEKEGFTHVTMFAGSDRVPEFTNLITKYNGKEYTFEKITVKSAGERDPDADDVSGMSASKMRALAKDDKVAEFLRGAPNTLKSAQAKNMFNAVRKALLGEDVMEYGHDERFLEFILESDMKDDLSDLPSDGEIAKHFDSLGANDLDLDDADAMMLDIILGGEQDKEDIDEARVLTFQQRQKLSQRMKAVSKRLARLRQIKAKVMPTQQRLRMHARKAALMILRRRATGRKNLEYNTLSRSQRIAVDTALVQRFGKNLNTLVGRLATRIMPRVRKHAQEYMKKAREQIKEQTIDPKSKKPVPNQAKDNPLNLDATKLDVLDIDPQKNDRVAPNPSKAHLNKNRRATHIKIFDEGRKSSSDKDSRDAGDTNIIYQMRKTINSRGEHETEFTDGHKMHVSIADAKKLLARYETLRLPNDKLRFTVMAASSMKNFKDILAHGLPKETKKKISLGGKQFKEFYMGAGRTRTIAPYPQHSDEPPGTRRVAEASTGGVDPDANDDPNKSRKTNQKLDLLLRLGLADGSELQKYRRALRSSKKQALQSPEMRKKLADLLDKLIDLTTGDPTTFSRVRQRVMTKEAMSLLNKAEMSGVDVDIIFEVFSRGYNNNEDINEAFSRVNSFIAGGKAVEMDKDLSEAIEHKKGKIYKDGKWIGTVRHRGDSFNSHRTHPIKKVIVVKSHKTRADAEKHIIKSHEMGEAVKEPTGGLKDACWKGYTAVGMKMKNGRSVPNCVPKESNDCGCGGNCKCVKETQSNWTKARKDNERSSVAYLNRAKKSYVDRSFEPMKKDLAKVGSSSLSDFLAKGGKIKQLPPGKKSLSTMIKPKKYMTPNQAAKVGVTEGSDVTESSAFLRLKKNLRIMKIKIPKSLHEGETIKFNFIKARLEDEDYLNSSLLFNFMDMEYAGDNVRFLENLDKVVRLGQHDIRLITDDGEYMDIKYGSLLKYAYKGTRIVPLAGVPRPSIIGTGFIKDTPKAKLLSFSQKKSKSVNESQRTADIKMIKVRMPDGTMKFRKEKTTTSVQNESYTGSEATSSNKNDPANRFVGTDEIRKNYASATPGQEQVAGEISVAAFSPEKQSYVSPGVRRAANEVDQSKQEAGQKTLKSFREALSGIRESNDLNEAFSAGFELAPLARDYGIRVQSAFEHHPEVQESLAAQKQVANETVEEDKKGHKSPSGGLTQKGRDYYNRQSGGNLKAPVTKEPSKLKKGSKSANRRKSFCARMGGMKKRLTSAKTANDPDSRINKALRKWNC